MKNQILWKTGQSEEGGNFLEYKSTVGFEHKTTQNF